MRQYQRRDTDRAAKFGAEHRKQHADDEREDDLPDTEHQREMADGEEERGQRDGDVMLSERISELRQQKPPLKHLLGGGDQQLTAHHIDERCRQGRHLAEQHRDEDDPPAESKPDAGLHVRFCEEHPIVARAMPAAKHGGERQKKHGEVHPVLQPPRPSLR